MTDDLTDWDNEREHREESANDPDRQRMEYAHNFGAWDTPADTERKLKEWNAKCPN